MKRWIFLVALFGLWPGGHLPAQEAGGDSDFTVVVNAANEIDAMERSRISKMFLKQIRSWPDTDEFAKPVDQTDDSAVREAFTLAIHRKKVSAIKSYWQRRIFAGRDVPPPEEKSDQAVLDFVRRERGAIGYVASGAELGEGVKELTVTE